MLPSTVDRERCITIIARCEAVHIPMQNSGCESSVRPWSSPSKADRGDLDCVVHSGVCTSATGLCGVVPERNNWGCSPTGLEGPDGAPATITRSLDEFVAPLDLEKRGDKVLALRTTRDLRGDFRQSVGCNDWVQKRLGVAVTSSPPLQSVGCNDWVQKRLGVAVTSSPPLGSLFRLSSTPHETVSNSRDMLTSIPCNSLELRDTVVGTVVESSAPRQLSSSRDMLSSIPCDSLGLLDTVVVTVVESSTPSRFQASTFVANDVQAGHAVARSDPNLMWAGASTQLFPRVFLWLESLRLFASRHGLHWCSMGSVGIAWVAWV